VVAALSRHVRKLPASLRRSLTWDRELEMAQHISFTVDTEVKVYFCDPQSPWQRGSNENTNGLLRQYFPERTDLSVHSQEELDEVALRLNQRPRKTLGFETPTSRLRASVAQTH
jgi:IS30 family transposase